MIKRAKAMCDYLLVGAYSDEYVRYYKLDYPFISENERVSILDSIQYVDEAVCVDFNNVDLIRSHDTWNYDVHFAGSDHEDAKEVFEKRFDGRNVSFEFFPYTQSTSSTKIKALINGKISAYGDVTSDEKMVSDKKMIKLSSAFSEKELYKRRYEAVLSSFMRDDVATEKFNVGADESQRIDGEIEQNRYLNMPIIIYGAGQKGKQLAMNLKMIDKNVVGFIDADVNKHGIDIEGIRCGGVNDFMTYKENTLVISTVYSKEVEKNLIDSNYKFLDFDAIRFLS